VLFLGGNTLSAFLLPVILRLSKDERGEGQDEGLAIIKMPLTLGPLPARRGEGDVSISRQQTLRVLPILRDALFQGSSGCRDWFCKVFLNTNPVMLRRPERPSRSMGTVHRAV